MTRLALCCFLFVTGCGGIVERQDELQQDPCELRLAPCVPSEALAITLFVNRETRHCAFIVSSPDLDAAHECLTIASECVPTVWVQATDGAAECNEPETSADPTQY